MTIDSLNSFAYENESNYEDSNMSETNPYGSGYLNKSWNRGNSGFYK